MRYQPQATVKKNRDGVQTFELRAGTAVAEVVPGRGGIVTRFAVDDDEVLYLEPETLRDPTQKVRGGIPVLFPIAGRLTGDRYTALGQSYPMRQHGLARHAAWTVLNVVEARLTMEFRSSSMSMVNFPFEFSYRMTVDVGQAGYRSMVIDTEVENLGKHPMPLHCGLHPYFAAPDAEKESLRVEVSAQNAYDNLTGQRGSFTGIIEFAGGEVDLHLSGGIQQGAKLYVPGKQPRLLSWSDMYQVVVLWTQQYKDFVCVEPWTGPGDALNSGEGLSYVEPGEVREGRFIIAV